MRLLLTGASGFIGNRLLRALIEKYGDKSVAVLSSKNIDHVTCYRYKSIQEFDIQEINFKDITHIIHAGAYTPKKTSQADSIVGSFSNVEFTKNLLSYEFNALERIINISTLDVYSKSSDKISERSNIDPASLYGMSKLYCEKMIASYSKHHNVKNINLRVGHVYGPGEQGYEKVIPASIKKILENTPLQLWGDGRELRSFIYIDDVVKSIINSIDSQINYKDINVVSGNSISILELMNMLTSFKAQQHEITTINPDHKGRDLIFDNNLLLNSLLKKEMDFKTGLRIEYDYMKRIYENNI